MTTFTKRLFAALALTFAFGVTALAADSYIPSDGLFESLKSPVSHVTNGDVYATVARLDAAMKGNALPTGDDYAMFTYCRDNGYHVGTTYFDGYATRKTAACLAATLLEKNEALVINRVSVLPDMSEDDDGYAEVLKCYKTGVITGTDDKHTFNGDDYIVSAEWNRIVERILFESRRVVFSPMLSVREEKQPYQLCYADNFNLPNYGIESGWVYENTAGAYKTDLSSGCGTLYDVMTDEHSRIVRYFNTFEGDKFEFRTRIYVSLGFDGLSLEFCDENDNAVYRLVADHGYFCTQNADGTLTEVMKKTSVGLYTFRIVVDMASGYARTIINNVDYGTSPLIGASIRYFALSSSDDDVLTASFNSGVYMNANYEIYEDFYNTDDVPCDMIAKGDVSVSDAALLLSPSSSVTRSFEPLAGKVSYSFNVFFPDNTPSGLFALRYDDREIVKFIAYNGVLYANDVNHKVGTYTGNLWNKLRVIADTDTQKADVYLNGKKAQTVDFLSYAPFLDNISLKNTASAGSDIQIDDIKVCNQVQTTVPVPEKPADTAGYTVGINICSLWNNGESLGWNAITPYEDIKPVLGYYDEGNPETSDWENKYMAEHGIDFGAYCWYASSADAPMKKTSMSAALDDGYMYSAYSDYVDFSLIWEAQNGKRPASSEAFRKYYVPYLIANYFIDERYATLDGKLVFSIFGLDSLAEEYASHTDGVSLKADLDYMRNAVMSATGKGMIITASGSCTDDLSSYGIDGWQAYAWNTDGNTFANVRDKILQKHSAKDVYTVPTVTTGYNTLPWYGKRYDTISVADFNALNAWVRDTYLPTYAQSDSLSWNDKLVWVATWNEYGEGTYLMPCDGLNGFGYLDSLRTYYTDGGAHTDVRPTDAQKARINHSYPQDLIRIEPDGYLSNPEDVGVTLTVNGKKLTGVLDEIENLNKKALPGVVGYGVAYIPFEPNRTMIDTYLYVAYYWDNVNGRLTLRRDGNTYVFTMGASAYTENGVQKTLTSGVPYLMDGVPMLPIKALADALGFTCTNEGNAYAYTTPEEKMFAINKDEEKQGIWIFEGVRNMRSWGTMNTDISFTDDGLSVTSRNNDPQIFSASGLGLDCAAFTGIEVKIKYTETPTAYANRMQMFFITDESTTWEEAKSAYVDLASFDSDGAFETYRFDMSGNANWTGTLRQLRFDPFNALGNAEIAYIKLVA